MTETPDLFLLLNSRTSTPTRSPTITLTRTATPSSTTTPSATPTPSFSTSPTQSPTRTISATFTVTPVVRFALQLAVYDSMGKLVALVFDGFVPGPPGAALLNHDPFVLEEHFQLAVSSADGTVMRLWNGFASDGLRSYPGAYILQARYQEIGKDVAEVRGTPFTLLWRTRSLLASAVISPNPALPGAGLVRLRWTPMPGLTLRGRAYNLAGELVKTLVRDGSDGFADWDLRTNGGQPVADGVYVWVLEAADANGEVVERAFKKHVIMR